MTVSFLERVVLHSLRERDSGIARVKLNNPDWREELGMDPSWPGWPLIDGLTRLRHCFAHEYGRATEAQLPSLQELIHRLADEPIVVSWMNSEHPIGQFFSLDPETADVVLSSSAGLSPSQAIRITFLSFLAELEKVGVVDMREWREGSA